MSQERKAYGGKPTTLTDLRDKIMKELFYKNGYLDNDMVFDAFNKHGIPSPRTSIPPMVSMYCRKNDMVAVQVTNTYTKYISEHPITGITAFELATKKWRTQ